MTAKQIVLEKLARPRAESGAVLDIPDSALDEFVGACWYACVIRHCPSEESMLLSNGSGYELVGELSEFAISAIEGEFERFAHNLSTGWVERLMRDFSSTGGLLLGLRKADYKKHEVGNSDDIRKKESESRGESQLCVRLDEDEQSRICDQAFASFFKAKLDQALGEPYCDLDLDERYESFLACWQEVFGKGFRVCVELAGSVGFDEGNEVCTLYAEYSPEAGYHIYPAILSADQLKESIFVD